jgi:hypothetical protein
MIAANNSLSSVLDERIKIFENYIAKCGLERKQYQVEGVRCCLKNELRDDPPCGVRGGFIADEGDFDGIPFPGGF